MNLAQERLSHLAEKLRLPDAPSLVGTLAQEAATKEWSFADFAEAFCCKRSPMLRCAGLRHDPALGRVSGRTA